MGLRGMGVGWGGPGFWEILSQTSSFGFNELSKAPSLSIYYIMYGAALQVKENLVL
jgi:hypothetical protein